MSERKYSAKFQPTSQEVQRFELPLSLVTLQHVRNYPYQKNKLLKMPVR